MYNKHFIDLNQIQPSDLIGIISLAEKLKRLNYQDTKNLLSGKNLAMIFEKSSTRTRVSFEVGMNQLGGSAVVMNKNDMQLGKGETVADTAKVLSRFVDAVMIRCNEHSLLEEMTKHSDVPIINALSNYSHPCQIMASILTIKEVLGSIQGKKLSWFGDANNVLNSYIHGAKIFDYQLDIAIPEGIDFSNNEIKKAQESGAKINLYHDAAKASKNSDVFITDTWVSMGYKSDGDTKEKEMKLKLLKPFQVNDNLMNLANKDAIFTHCLPAYRGFEVEASVVDGQKSVVFQEAENRLHAQKAILLWLFNIKDPCKSPNFGNFGVINNL
jgi:ornithine carbamoyltransferase